MWVLSSQGSVEGKRELKQGKMTNPVSNHDMKVFSGLSNPGLSRKIAKYCGVKLSSADFNICTNGESEVEIQDSVRGKNVYVVQSSGRDTNNHLMGLLLFIQACKLAGARRITAVLPMLPYARGDHKQPDRRMPIPAKIIAGILETAGVSQVITVDIHSPQTEAFFSIPVDCLTTRFLFECWVKENVSGWESSVVCSPDEGGTRRAGMLAERLRLPMALIHRDRLNSEHIISGDVKNKTVILVDDMVDTCYTLLNALNHLVNVGGAASIYILVTHAVLSQVPGELFQHPQLKRMVVSNTVTEDYGHLSEKITVLDVSDVIGEAIRNQNKIKMYFHA
ncbi:ribose-phosphate pyrophosphokinase 2 [Eurytemora carolleeae]|uniref:ribose-phosphate pyrophosphokinase 2 n=1 Tax=Eurytemora carolleeae TaxID=1294199 RepID=UPI000C76B8BD|nr:ribose-phosphate pyrophosphokinase 2 [Eurytemora carolleeae]|eukprot:XP_023331550.1 ribose-phosphate pyrophosphokinase 2-like [Eurytemora affinis]